MPYRPESIIRFSIISPEERLKINDCQAEAVDGEILISRKTLLSGSYRPIWKFRSTSNNTVNNALITFNKGLQNGIPKYL